MREYMEIVYGEVRYSEEIQRYEYHCDRCSIVYMGPESFVTENAEHHINWHNNDRPIIGM